MQWLYDANPAQKRRALGRVSAWKARASVVPIPVDLTADLVECQLMEGGIPKNDSRQISLMLAMALTRLVCVCVCVCFINSLNTLTNYHVCGV